MGDHYRLRPVETLGVMQWIGRWSDELTRFLSVHASSDTITHEEGWDHLTVHTLDGPERAEHGDWLVKRLVEDSAGGRFSELRVVKAVV